MTTSKHTMKTLLTGAIVLVMVLSGSASLAGSCSGSAATTASIKTDIVSTAASAGSFNTLIAALQAAGLEDALRGDGPLTVFAPTDDAFAKLPKGTLESLLLPENKEMLVSILTYHVAPGSLTAERIVGLDRIKTLNGDRPAVEVDHGTVMLDDATVTATDIMASNGVIHVIDSVLLPGTNADSRMTSSTDAARKLISMAIDRGVPLFNDGQPAACAAVYEIAAQGLVASNDLGLSRGDRATLAEALDRSARTHDARRSAWIMRDALDEVMDSLGHDAGRMMSRR